MAMLLALCAACGGQVSKTIDAGAVDISQSSDADGAAPALRIDPCATSGGVLVGRCLFDCSSCAFEFTGSVSCAAMGLCCCVTVLPH